jgi:hypothetical protein
MTSAVGWGNLGRPLVTAKGDWRVLAWPRMRSPETVVRGLPPRGHGSIAIVEDGPAPRQ